MDEIAALDGRSTQAMAGAVSRECIPLDCTSPRQESVWTERGSGAHRRISFALFLAGFATFSLLYCVQPLLPELAREFRVGAAVSSFALSLTTGFLAIAILCAGAVSEVLGRRGLMFMAMSSAAFLNFVAALAPNWPILLAARACEGFVLGGVPAVAMAYLSEEIHPADLGYTMGLYVGGTAFGGMFGRVGVGLLTQLTSWRIALGTLAAIDLIAAFGLVALLPASRNFLRRPGLDVGYHLRAWGGHLRHRCLPLLFAIGGLAMGAFVTVYNYADFRLVAAPYRLSQTEISLIFLAYLFAMVASPVAGALADRLGRGPVLIAGLVIAAIGVGFTIIPDLFPIVVGIVALTVGFFIAHSVASGWVGRLASGAKGHAASLYLLSYYLGSSVMGSAGGWFWTWKAWPAVAAFAGALLVVALMAAIHLDHQSRQSAR